MGTPIAVPATVALPGSEHSRPPGFPRGPIGAKSPNGASQDRAAEGVVPRAGGRLMSTGGELQKGQILETIWNIYEEFYCHANGVATEDVNDCFARVSVP